MGQGEASDCDKAGTSLASRQSCWQNAWQVHSCLSANATSACALLTVRELLSLLPLFHPPSVGG